MKPIKSLEGKKVAIIGLGVSQVDFVIALENSKEWDEVWGINSAGAVYHLDRLFMLDPPSRFLDTDDAGRQTDVMRKILPKLKIPIYTCELDERVPSAKLYPIDEVTNYAKCAYFNNTVAYAIAFAYWNKVGAIDLFGIDFSYAHDLHFAEAGRACVEFWLCKLIENNIVVGVSPRSTVLDSCVALDERLYGYHRLKDPLVAVPHESNWIIGTVNEVETILQKDDLTIIQEEKPPEPYKG